MITCLRKIYPDILQHDDDTLVFSIYQLAGCLLGDSWLRPKKKLFLAMWMTFDFPCSCIETSTQPVHNLERNLVWWQGLTANQVESYGLEFDSPAFLLLLGVKHRAKKTLEGNLVWWRGLPGVQLEPYDLEFDSSAFLLSCKDRHNKQKVTNWKVN